MPTTWTFRCYRDASGQDVISEWYEDQTEEVKATFDTRVEFLKHADPNDWDRPAYGKLGGECAGLGEIRFKAGRTQYRPLGFTSPGRVFTLVFVAKEKDGNFVPPNACETALNRKAEIANDGSRVDVCKCI